MNNPLQIYKLANIVSESVCYNILHCSMELQHLSHKIGIRIKWVKGQGRCSYNWSIYLAKAWGLSINSVQNRRNLVRKFDEKFGTPNANRGVHGAPHE